MLQHQQVICNNCAVGQYKTHYSGSSQVSPASGESDPAPWNSAEPAAKVTADVQSAKLKQLLGKIKTG